MIEKDSDKKKRLTAELKKLRLQRDKVIRRVRDVVKQQRRSIEAIEGALKSGPRTVPEISGITGLPSHEVLWWIGSLKKYGLVAEDEKRGSYFAYRLVNKAGQDGE